MRFPKELYTAASLGTLAGSSFAVWLFSNLVARVMLGWNPAVLGFLFAQVLTFAGLLALPSTEFQPRRKIVAPILVAFCNGMLIYWQSTGIDSINHGIPSAQRSVKKATLIPIADSSPWWPAADQQIAIGQVAETLVAAVKPLAEASKRLAAPNRIVIEHRRVAELQRQQAQQRLSELKRDLEKARETERETSARQPRPGELVRLERDVAAKQTECARLEGEIGKAPKAMREEALRVYEQCARELHTHRQLLDTARAAIEALKKATQRRQTLEKELVVAVQSEQETAGTLAKLQRLERAIADAQQTDQELGNLVFGSLAGGVQHSTQQIQEAAARLERAYLRPALGMGR